MPYLTSNLEILAPIPTDLSQWRRSCLGGIKSIMIRTVSTAMINGEKYPFVIYIFGMLGREYLVVLSNFSQLVAAKIDKLILYG